MGKGERKSATITEGRDVDYTRLATVLRQTTAAS